MSDLVWLFAHFWASNVPLYLRRRRRCPFQLLPSSHFQGFTGNDDYGRCRWRQQQPLLGIFLMEKCVERNAMTTCEGGEQKRAMNPGR